MTPALSTKTVRIDVLQTPPMLALAPPHRAHAGKEAHPVVKQDEDEKCHQKRKRHRERLLADDRLEQPAQTLD
jgi:hypothetical protein